MQENYLAIYLTLTLLQMWFTRNSTINWYNKTIKNINWEDTSVYSIMIIGYVICFIPFIAFLTMQPKYWTLKYIKPIKRY